MRILPSGELTASFDADCRGTREILSLVGDKWSVLVVVTLGHEPHRFNALKRTIGNISQRVLSGVLRNLERDGIVLRTVHPTTPPQVEYGLTPLGVSLLGPVRVLATWARDHREDVKAARTRYDESDPS